MRFVAVDRDWPDEPGFRSLSAAAERLFWRLMISGDAHGNHRGEVVHIQSMLDMTTAPAKSIEKWIDELVSVGLIVKWNDRARKWLEIVDYDKHQTDRMLEGRPERVAPPVVLSQEVEPMVAAGPASSMLSEGDDRHNADVATVFTYWAEVEERTGGIKGAKLTAGRRKRIAARLSEGYTVEQLCSCVDGYLADPFYLGTKPGSKGTRYTGLDTIILNGERVERGVAMAATIAKQSKTSERFSAYDKVGA